jgi:hypothetical protein
VHLASSRVLVLIQRYMISGTDDAEVVHLTCSHLICHIYHWPVHQEVTLQADLVHKPVDKLVG